MITASDLAAMQATQALTLTTACNIVRRTYASDGMGGQTETLVLIDALCRIVPSANMPDYSIFAARAVEHGLFRVTFAAGTDVRKDDQIITLGQTLEVLGVLAPKTVETARVVIAVEA